MAVKTFRTGTWLAAVLVTVLAASDLHAQPGWFRGAATSDAKIEASPLLADLSWPPDGRMEIIVPSFDDKLHVYRHDGSLFPGQWPRTLGFGDGTIASVAVGNIDASTSEPEIIAVGDNKLARSVTVKVYRPNGVEMASLVLNSNASGKATPCIIDCFRYSGASRQPAEEIVIRDGDGRVHTLYWNGSALVNLYNTTALDTCTSDTQRDQYGSQPITPSVSAYFDENAGVTYLIAASTDNRIYRWRISSEPGAGMAQNWAVTPRTSLQSSFSNARFLSSPSLADLDNDGVMEIIAATNRRQVYVWKNDTTGTLYSGWPQTVPEAVVSSPAVADVNLDGGKEVIVGCDDGRVYVWSSGGGLLPGWPKSTGGDVFGSPVAAELDGQVGLEIVATSLDGSLHAWDHTGIPLYGWPKRLNRTGLYASPAIGNIHRGERMAVVAASYEGRVFVFDLAPKSLDVTLGWQQFRGGPKRQGTGEGQ